MSYTTRNLINFSYVENLLKYILLESNIYGI